MTEILRIARACFIGGVLCVAVALQVAPKVWWLGIPAGLSGGYLSYRFREVLLAIPQAIKTGLAVVRAMSGIVVDFARDWWADSRIWAQEQWKWLQRPHPFFYPAFGTWAAVWTTMMACIIPWHTTLYDGRLFYDALAVMVIAILFGVAACVPAVVVGGLLLVLGLLGAFITENSLWHGNIPMLIPGGANGFTKRGIKCAPLTYANAYRWIGKLLLYVLWSLVRLPLKLVDFACTAIILGGYALDVAITFAPAFVAEMVRLMHCNQRVLCAVDGTLGGLVALLGFYFYGPLEPTSVDYAVTALFGGLIGAVLGIANWELVSKRCYGYGVSA